MTWKHIEWTGLAAGGLLLMGVVMASSVAAEPAGGPAVTTTATATVTPEPGLEKLAQTPRIRLICGLAPEKGYLPRLQAIHALGTSLTDPETVALLAFLDQKKPDTATLEVLDFDALKNDITDVLLKQPVLPGALAPQLLAMYRDTTHDDAWRNYCIQFLARLYPRLEEKEQAQVRQLFQDALLERQKSFSGTALIALKNFADRPEFDRAEIGNAAMTLLRAPDTLPYIKATALQVAAILGQPEAPVVARQWLAAPGTEITLRISAIATLGQRGVPGDLAILKPLTRGGDTRIVTAARAAVAKLDPVKPANKAK